MIIACRDCGTIRRIPPMMSGTSLRCYRCAWSVRRGAALMPPWRFSIATLVLWIPVNLGTPLTIQVLGIKRSSRLISGVFSMWHEGWFLLALVVGAQGVVLPFFRFGLLTAALASIRFNRQGRWLALPSAGLSISMSGLCRTCSCSLPPSATAV